MKFKMAKHSIFATLLRSPWWVSLLVAAAISVLALSLLPREYAPLGPFAALPFFVIALIALWKQMRQPSSARVEDTVDALQNMAWPAFSALLEKAFERDGCTVRRLKGTDADVELSRKDSRALVAARRWKAARTGVEPLRTLREAATRQQANECIYVALGEFSDPAIRYANENGIQIMGAAELARLIPRDLLRS